MQIFQNVYKLLKKCENINVFVSKEDYKPIFLENEIKEIFQIIDLFSSSCEFNRKRKSWKDNHDFEIQS